MGKLCHIIFDDPERDSRVVAYADRFVGMAVAQALGVTAGVVARIVAASVAWS